MQVSVTFRHVNPSLALRQYAEQKLARLGKYLPRVSSAHVVLSVEKREHKAEISVHARGRDLTAAEVTDDLYAAVDLALDKLERQAKKLAGRRKDHKHVVRAGDHGSGVPGGEPVVLAERVAVKPMSVDEAVEQLRKAKVEFLLFRDADSENLCVLYRKRNGRFGLLEAAES
ncbi:MAG: ribose ABC transporter permease [Candidatus Binatia bacterium]|nr:MAG: ribose ABC transporter permease [Candidatus Binatia bacterium]